MPRNRTPEDYLRRRGKNSTAPLVAEHRPQLPIDRIVRVSRKGERVVSSERYLNERQQIEAIDLELKKKDLPPGELLISRDESGHAWEDQRANLAEARFRNYIHPYEQIVHRFRPDQHTVDICWQVFRAAYSQIKTRKGNLPL